MYNKVFFTNHKEDQELIDKIRENPSIRDSLISEYFRLKLFRSSKVGVSKEIYEIIEKHYPECIYTGIAYRVTQGDRNNLIDDFFHGKNGGAITWSENLQRSMITYISHSMLDECEEEFRIYSANVRAIDLSKIVFKSLSIHLDGSDVSRLLFTEALYPVSIENYGMINNLAVTELLNKISEDKNLYADILNGSIGREIFDVLLTQIRSSIFSPKTVKCIARDIAHNLSFEVEEFNWHRLGEAYHPLILSLIDKNQLRGNVYESCIPKLVLLRDFYTGEMLSIGNLDSVGSTILRGREKLRVLLINIRFSKEIRNLIKGVDRKKTFKRIIEAIEDKKEKL